MKLLRVVHMGIPELACRGRQEASKWLERIGVAGRAASPPGEATTVFAEFRQGGQARFFEGATNAETPRLITQNVPAYRDETVAVADAVCQRHFDLLGHRGLTFGDPVDWHLDPITGRRAPRVHWSRLDPLDPASVGDSKVVWELNRHQWLVRLGTAYRLTGDERYARTFANDVRAWMRANPPGIGINWASSLEVALRLISWCWALTLFRGSRTLAPELFEMMLNAIWIHASHVERYLSSYSSPNTHLTGEALGLLYAGIIFSDLRKGARWRAQGIQILMEESERQILPDGTYFEQSTCYQ